MLDGFIRSNREAILAGSRARVRSRTSPKPTDVELANGIPVFLDQLGDALRLAKSTAVIDHEPLGKSAERHGSDLFRMGLTLGQVVHDYGDVCQIIAELAVEQQLSISGEELRLLSRCLDDAIAGAVTEWSRQQEIAIHGQATERLGVLVHELRNLLHTGLLAYESVKSGQVAIGGSTGQLLGRSLTGLRDLIDRSLADVRLDAGIERLEQVPVADFLAEIEIGAAMLARARGIQFTASSAPPGLAIDGDRQILAAAVSNLLQNAFKFTRKGGMVSLTTHVTPSRVLFEIEDECGGLPPGKVEELFAPYSQRGDDRSGVGLGLPISLKAARANGGEITVQDLPGKGCVFTLSLPRPPPPVSAVGGGDRPAGSSGALGPTGPAKASGGAHLPSLLPGEVARCVG